MASLFRLGDRWVCDIFGKGRVRLGKNKSDAQFHFRYIEKIEQAQKVGLPAEPAALDWLRNAPPALRKRLQKIGLLSGSSGRTLGDLVEIFGAQPGKPNTRRIRKNGLNNLVEFLGAEIPLVDIQPADALAFKTWMLTKAKKVAKDKPVSGLAPATAARRFKWARGAFHFAVKMGWTASNPFNGIPAGKMSNPSRAYYVAPDIAAQLIDEIPGAENRLLIALGRWGGLRLPSEAVDFKWTNVDWASWSMTFASAKTEAYEGMEQRTCPVFKELQPYFLAAVEAAQPGEEFTFPGMRAAPFARDYCAQLVDGALRRLGLEPWPRLLGNLRASRATEIDKQFGGKCESEWIGHGAVTAMKHYLMVVDDDWQKATGVSRNPAEETSKEAARA